MSADAAAILHLVVAWSVVMMVVARGSSLPRLGEEGMVATTGWSTVLALEHVEEVTTAHDREKRTRERMR